MPLAAKRGLSFVSLSLLCLFLAPGAGATVYRDRAAFGAARHPADERRPVPQQPVAAAAALHVGLSAIRSRLQESR